MEGQKQINRCYRIINYDCERWFINEQQPKQQKADSLKSDSDFGQLFGEWQCQLGASREYDPDSHTVGVRQTIRNTGRPDVLNDATAKAWLYFKLHGNVPQKLRIVIKYAHHLRKYAAEKRIKPRLFFSIESQQWVPFSDQLIFTEGFDPPEAFCLFSRDGPTENNIVVEIASYAPYTQNKLTYFLQSAVKSSTKVDSSVLFPVKTPKQRQIPLIITTSKANRLIDSTFESVEGKSNEQNVKQLIKWMQQCYRQLPIVLVTARVHPSEVPSSYFAQNLIQLVTTSTTAQVRVLRDIFIFVVVPLVNPDGVEEGYYRTDPQGKNLNRYYSHSDPNRTPSIYLIEQFILYMRQQERLFMYIDVHSHQSPKPSYIFGNYSEDTQIIAQSKLFCRSFERHSKSRFSCIDSDFSKKQLNLRERRDQYSKQCSGRVFAGRSDEFIRVIHSYTLQIAPFCEQLESIGDYSNILAQAFLISLADILGLYPLSPICALESIGGWKNSNRISSQRSQKSLGAQFQDEYLKVLWRNPSILQAMKQSSEAMKLEKYIQFVERAYKLNRMSFHRKRDDNEVEIINRKKKLRTEHLTGAISNGPPLMSLTYEEPVSPSYPSRVVRPKALKAISLTPINIHEPPTPECIHRRSHKTQVELKESVGYQDLTQQVIFGDNLVKTQQQSANLQGCLSIPSSGSRCQQSMGPPKKSSQLPFRSKAYSLRDNKSNEVRLRGATNTHNMDVRENTYDLVLRRIKELPPISSNGALNNPSDGIQYPILITKVLKCEDASGPSNGVSSMAHTMVNHGQPQNAPQIRTIECTQNSFEGCQRIKRIMNRWKRRKTQAE